MIVRDRPGLPDLLFAVRGSILPRIRWQLGFLLVISLAAVLLLAHGEPGPLERLAVMPFTLIGLSLSIFMSFRNTACYDRWWEGRKLWGQAIISARCFARQISGLDVAERRPLLLGICSFAGGLAARLRGTDEQAAIARYLPPAMSARGPTPTDTVLREVGRACIALRDAQRIDPNHYTVLEVQLTELSHVQGGCERINTAPLPFSYSLLLHRTAYAFCIMLPFALAPSLGWWTPLPTLLVGYAFFGLDALGDELCDPFGTEPNDLPLDTMVRTIERDMLDAAGDTDLPAPVEMQGFLLM